jgi:hypothetical protein
MKLPGQRELVLLVMALALWSCGGDDPDDPPLVPVPTCGDGLVEALESCEPPTSNCSDACQLSGEVVQQVVFDWGCEPMDIEVLPSGDPVVLCDGSSVRVARLDALGRVLWSDDWQDPDGVGASNAETNAVDLAIGPSGGQVVVVGSAGHTVSSLHDFVRYTWIRRYHQDGQLVWQRNFRQDGGWPRGACVDAEGEVYLSYAWETGVLVRLDALTGETIWTRTWGIGSETIDDGVVTCTEQGPVVSNELEWDEPRNRAIRLRAFDREGEPRWLAEHDIDPGGWDFGNTLVSSSAGVVMAGMVEHDVSYDYHPAFSRFDADGELLATWEAPEFGKVRAAAVDESGVSYIYATDDPYEETKTLRVYEVDALGQTGWVHESSYTSPALSFQGGIAIDTFGRVVFFEGLDEGEPARVELVWVGQ